jgi:hypothetical protein
LRPTAALGDLWIIPLRLRPTAALGNLEYLWMKLPPFAQRTTAALGERPNDWWQKDYW